MSNEAGGAFHDSDGEPQARLRPGKASPQELLIRYLVKPEGIVATAGLSSKRDDAHPDSVSEKRREADQLRTASDVPDRTASARATSFNIA